MKHSRIVNSIEFTFLLIGFVINFVWEMLQMPFFEFPDTASRFEIALSCAQASLGDAIMLLISFWILTVIFASRLWIFQLNLYRIGLFLSPGIVLTVLFEALATGPLQRWTYGDLMPTIPGLGTGILPIIQWLLVPLVVLYLVRKQTRQVYFRISAKDA